MVNKAPRGWRIPRKLKPADNLGLPVPRLEIRYQPLNGEVFALYSLVYRHLMGDILAVSLGGTVCGGARVTDPEYLELPFRDGAHIINDMWELRLPGFVVNGKKFKPIVFEPDAFPGGLVKKMAAEKEAAK
jgi:hypothetical protein